MRPSQKITLFLMDTLESMIFMGALFMVIYIFIAQPNEVKGASMEPNLHTGDRLITSKVTYKFEDMKRGDIIVIHAPTNYDIEYIKRLIGLPGETILIQKGNVYINGKKLEEGYLKVPTAMWLGWKVEEGKPFKVPAGYIFVMGDNRPNSLDSREFGPVTIDSIVGKATYRYYPLQSVGTL